MSSASASSVSLQEEMSGDSSEVSLADRSLSGSQSLFNIYFLGQAKVDRRCNSAMMPWIIEELKLKADEMKFIWLSPGPEEMSFVADNGQELFKHSYGNILHCCIAVDGISLAYAARQEKDKYFCYVFQALTYEEAAKIMRVFKEHSQEEVTVPPTISHSMGASSPVLVSEAGKSSGYIMSSSQNGSLAQEEEYKLEYWGRHEVPPPSSGNTDQVVFIDTLVAKLRESRESRESSSALSKLRSKKRSFGSRFGRSSTAKTPAVEPGCSTSQVDSDPRHGCSTGQVDSDPIRHVAAGSVESLSDADSCPTHKAGSAHSSSSEGGDAGTPITITAASPPPDEGEEEGEGHSPQDPADHHSSCHQMVHPELSDRLRPNSSSDFDTIPELANLKSSTEFQALSLKDTLSGSASVQRVKLLFSGVSVLVFPQHSDQIILKKSIRNIACCAQGGKETEFVAFISRNKANMTYYCYLFSAKNSKKAIKVLESFKSAFVHALSMTMPPAVCEYCPYNRVQELCKCLEGVSTQVAQSKIQNCLSTLSEADYNQVMVQYKSSEHADHDYTEIIVLVALLRQHFQRKQEKHTHRGLLPPKWLPSSSKPPTRVHSGFEESSAGRLSVPALTRAKLAITSSFENLRSKPATERKQKSKPEKNKNTADTHSQSMSGHRSSSPLFARRTSIATLMAPVTNSPVKGGAEKEEDGKGRNRSWTAGVGEIRYPLQPLVSEQSNDTSSTNQKQHNDEPKQDAEKDVFKTPHRSFAASKRSFGSQKMRRLRHSLTPPSSASVGEYLQRSHRRSSSNVVHGSWRQEIFDSVCTPTKLESGFPRADSDILEEWQVIEIGTGSWKTSVINDSPQTRARKRWHNAIKQQIVLNQMERENRLVKKEERNRLKMHSFLTDSSESLAVWAKLLELKDAEHSTKDIHDALLLGVPHSRREEVWAFLSDLYQARNKPQWQYPAQLSGEETLNQLGQESTEYEHSIEVDLSRTFPSHPYFSSKLLEAGQAELHSILHGYAVADPETGYCQGLSFVTGIILVHTTDKQSAFKMLYKLMNLHDYKDIYRGSLSNLQTRLYQLSRLMHDFIPAVHQLLQRNEVTPFFYAAPWFLTIFASQYPISFAARVFDMMFYEGTDILFKVALSLLKVHESALMHCNSMESICTYLKTRLPEEVLTHEDTILKQALQFDFEGKLELFETEYQVLEELNSRFCVDMPAVQDMENILAMLRKNNLALVEQLAICHGSITTLQNQVEALQQQMLTQQQRITRLECENSTPARTT